MNVGWYVSVKRGKRTRLLSGPYDLPPSSEQVKEFQKRAIDYDPWCHFDIFGVSMVETPNELPKAIFG